jgi:N-acetylmuramic acid 6-phosphate etherase
MRHIIGCMTGTSLDALDVALVRVQGNGLDLTAAPLAFHTVALGNLTDTLRDASHDIPLRPSALADARDSLGNLHAHAIDHLIAQHGPVSLVAAHGQTIHHNPPRSWQLLNPWPIAARAQCPVVHDLRSADLALGGQGAPITPLADWILFRSDSASRAIVNLGGFCNITLLPAASDTAAIRGFDVCACNHPLNTISRTLTNLPFDRNGKLASTGTINQKCSAELASLLAAQHDAGHALGTGDECLDWVHARAANHTAPDLLASAVDAIARTIADATSNAHEIYLAGGSTQNLTLVRAIQHHASAPVQSLNALGIDPLQREAVAIAILGALCEDGIPITLPSITGRTKSTLLHGNWANLNPPHKTPPQKSTTPTVTVKSFSPPDRSNICTEQRNPRTMSLDTSTVAQCVSLLNAEDAAIPHAVSQAAPQITAFIEAVEPRFGQGGRLIYIGAGTSGRLGVLDAAECPPTFQTDPSRIVGIIAGGDASLRNSSESKEDSFDGSHDQLRKLDLNERDSLLGIAAGATTPYVLGAIDFAQQLGTLTGFLTCSKPTSSTEPDHLLYINTGPEPITGSTRMKAGTATKLVLNTISTTLMIRMGKVYQNLMVDLRASNDKLRDRALRILMDLTQRDRHSAAQLLEEAGGDLKTAIVMHSSTCARQQAIASLVEHKGVLRAALQKHD